FAGPVLPDSWGAFIPALLYTLCLVIRADLEPESLRSELAGYESYTQGVRYQLVPYHWQEAESYLKSEVLDRRLTPFPAPLHFSIPGCNLNAFCVMFSTILFDFDSVHLI
ncbi:MAG: hypothetical protein ACWGN1_02410, partial [Desulfobulbales bacterium]